MIAYEAALIDPAREAGMAVPADVEGGYDAKLFPHFFVFSCWQLGRAMPTPTAHWDNAKIIAKIGVAEIHRVTFPDLARRGCV